MDDNQSVNGINSCTKNSLQENFGLALRHNEFFNEAASLLKWNNSKLLAPDSTIGKEFDFRWA